MSCCDSTANRSDMAGQVYETPATKNTTGTGFEVRGNEKLNYSFSFVDNVLDPAKEDLANYYTKWGRVLVIIDTIVYGIYGDKVRAYFAAHKIEPVFHVFKGGEVNKTMDTMLDMVDAMDGFGLIRTQPVLVIGGGLAGDVAGYAVASYRRNSNYIRIGTTLISLIDAVVSIKVGLNHKGKHGKFKNRLGAYHAPIHTFLDFEMIKTLPEGQTRNGFAELCKITHASDKPVWDLLCKYGPRLVKTAFGRTATGPDAEELKRVGDEICRRSIHKMLQLESGNLKEIGLDRVIASGHGLSVTLELACDPPLRHGHAISVDMSYTVHMSHARGYISDEERDQWFTLLKEVGLTTDHPLFDLDLVLKGAEAIKKTRDGLQRFVLAKPFGNPVFANDITDEEFERVLKIHKAYTAKHFPETGGVGIDAYADAGDLGGELEPQPEAVKAAATSAPKSSSIPLPARAELVKDSPVQAAKPAIAT